MGQTLPGFEADRTQTPRDIMLSRAGMIQVPIIVDGTNGIDGNNSVTDEIRAGWLMGQITTSELWVPCKRTAVTPTGGATSTDVPVIDASAFKAGDTISVGADTGLTVSSVNYTTNTITVSASFTFANDELVVAEDGSQTCRGILLDFVKLRNRKNDAAANKSAGMLIQGAVQLTLLLGDVAAIRADTAAKLAGIRFSDEHGQ